jgi:hypothetical protein
LSVVTMTSPPPPPADPQVPPPGQAIPFWLGAQYVPPMNSQTAHARLVPVGVGPLLPELLLELEEPLSVSTTPASSSVGAQPLGSSQHVAGMHVPLPPQSSPTSASVHSLSSGVVRTHAPAVQSAPPVQATPHPPQFFPSLVVSTQMSEHAVRP